MVSTPERCTNNSPITPNPSVPTKKPSARKPLRQFTDTLDDKHKTSVHGFGAVKANHKAIKKGNVVWSNNAMRRGHTKKSNDTWESYVEKFINLY